MFLVLFDQKPSFCGVTLPGDLPKFICVTTINTVEYDWDPAKCARSIAERGIDFALVRDFNWDTAVVIADTRRDYGEPRLRALGSIGNRLHVLVYTPRGELVWVISLRKANARERKAYAESQKN